MKKRHIFLIKNHGRPLYNRKPCVVTDPRYCAKQNTPIFALRKRRRDEQAAHLESIGTLDHNAAAHQHRRLPHHTVHGAWAEFAAPRAPLARATAPSLAGRSRFSKNVKIGPKSVAHVLRSAGENQNSKTVTFSVAYFSRGKRAGKIADSISTDEIEFWCSQRFGRQPSPTQRHRKTMFVSKPLGSTDEKEAEACGDDSAIFGTTRSPSHTSAHQTTRQSDAAADRARQGLRHSSNRSVAGFL